MISLRGMEGEEAIVSAASVQCYKRTPTGQYSTYSTQTAQLFLH